MLTLKMITLIYILNATLLVLHEIESGYEKEWEILKLPGKITGFLLLHIPLIIFMFYGLLEIDRLSGIGLICGVVWGLGGVVPFAVHKVFVRKKGHFGLWISNGLIYLNVLTGLALAYLSVRYII